MKQTVLQQEIERQWKIIEAEHEKERLDLVVLARAGEAIRLLESLLPASEQELKEAYCSGSNNTYYTESGEKDWEYNEDDWFRNEFGEG